MPIEEYLKLQGRFKHLFKTPEKIEVIKEQVKKRWDYLLMRHRLTHGTTDNIVRKVFYK